MSQILNIVLESIQDLPLDLCIVTLYVHLV